jgi:predicted DNA-binding protein (UPF0251 family)
MRQVLILHDVEGFTHQEIGDLLGVDPGTSKSQLFRARAKMRAHLKGQGHHVPERAKRPRATAAAQRANAAMSA